MSLLSERIKIIKVGAATGTGQGAINSTGGHERSRGRAVFVAPGAITGGAATSINAAQDVASNGSFTDLLAQRSPSWMMMTTRCFGSRCINRPSATSD